MATGGSTRWLPRAVLGTAAVAVFLWLCSYSWMVGLTPPTGWVDPEASPWLVAEIGAGAAGGLSLVTGAWLLRGSSARRTRALSWATAVGGFVTVLTLASLLQP